jgi:hypothetical protein
MLAIENVGEAGHLKKCKRELEWVVGGGMMDSTRCWQVDVYRSVVTEVERAVTSLPGPVNGGTELMRALHCGKGEPVVPT